MPSSSWSGFGRDSGKDRASLLIDEVIRECARRMPAEALQSEADVMVRAGARVERGLLVEHRDLAA